MSDTLHIKPKIGFSIRDPQLRDILPPEGRVVESSDYWHRRIRDEDVELIPAPATETKKKG